MTSLAKTYQLFDLLIGKIGNVVDSAIRKTNRVRLNTGFALFTIGLLGGARLVGSALAADEPVECSGAVTARTVRQADVSVAVGVQLACDVSAAATGVRVNLDAPVAGDLLRLVSSVSKRGRVSLTALAETLSLPLPAPSLYTQQTPGLMPRQPVQPPVQPVEV